MEIEYTVEKKYQVITKLTRVPLVIDPKMPIKDKCLILVARTKQSEVWRLVVKYFTQANGCWDEAIKTVRTETEFEIIYAARDYKDALKEVDNIKNKAFRNKGQLLSDSFRLKFKRFQNIKDKDPAFEKLRNNLANLGIYIDLEIKEILS